MTIRINVNKDMTATVFLDRESVPLYEKLLNERAGLEHSDKEKWKQLTARITAMESLIGQMVLKEMMSQRQKNVVRWRAENGLSVPAYEN